jgi:alpha-beta hydrolase superfamily lysophospholipase
MSKISDFTFPSNDGRHNVHVRQWLPETEEPVGVVQVLHGMAEHIGRYDDFARFLNDHGYIVVGNDHLGHGTTAESEEELGYFADDDSWMQVSNDTRTLQIMTARQFPNLPYFLFGHSMGSFLARTYLCRFPGTVTGAVLCGTEEMKDRLLLAALKAGRAEEMLVGRHGKSHLLAQNFAAYNRQFRPNRTAFDWLSINTENVDAYIADPLCGFPVTAGLFEDMLRGIAFTRDKQHLSHMKKDMPVLFISGSLDPVGEDGEGVRRAYDMFLDAGMKKASMHLYPGLRHEILNESGHEIVYDDVLTWLEQNRQETRA